MISKVWKAPVAVHWEGWGTSGDYLAYPAESQLYSGINQWRTQVKEKWPPIYEGQFLPINPVQFHRIEGYSTKGQAYYPTIYGGPEWATFTYSKRAYCNHPHLMQEVNVSIRPWKKVAQDQRDMAYVMALSRIDDKKVDVGLLLAELPETVLLIRKPLQSLASVTNRWLERTAVSYRRGIRKSSIRYTPKRIRKRDFAEAAANSWLVARYGVAPALMDVDAACKTAAGLNLKLQSKVYSAHGASTREFRSTRVNSSAIPLDTESIPPWRTSEMNIWEKCTAAYCVRYRFRPDMHDAAVLASWGVSPTQLGSLLYEATPLSFVLDWVTNLGQWIKAMEPKPHIEIVDVCLSEKHSRQVNFRDLRGSWINGYDNIGTGITGFLRVDGLDRTDVSHTLVAPRPHLRQGGVKLLQALDALSLIYQPFSKRIQKWA